MIDHARLAELMEEVGGDDLAEVIGLFCEEVEETLDRLGRHASPTLADDLHFLKGSALNIGMSDVGEMCRLAEQSLRADPSVPPDIDAIAQAFQQARQALYREMGG